MLVAKICYNVVIYVVGTEEYCYILGGKYKLDIIIPETYPFNPPKVDINFISYFFWQGYYSAATGSPRESLSQLEFVL